MSERCKKKSATKKIEDETEKISFITEKMRAELRKRAEKIKSLFN
jgi:hypothetical protein